jgi:hypothetical protein
MRSRDMIYSHIFCGNDVTVSKRRQTRASTRTPVSIVPFELLLLYYFRQGRIQGKKQKNTQRSMSLPLQLILTSIFGFESPLKIRENGETSVSGEETDGVVNKTKYAVVQLAALIALISGGLSIYLVNGLLADIMGLCVVLLAPVVALQKHKLLALGDFRSQHNQLRNQINAVHVQNDKLTESVTAMAAASERLQRTQEQLQKHAIQSGKSVQRLVELVDETATVQAEIRENLNAAVVQQMMTAILQTDSDRNFVLSKNEVSVLIVRLKSIPGITFHETAFRNFLNADDQLTLGEVCEIARHLRQPDSSMVLVEQHAGAVVGTPGGASASASAAALLSPPSEVTSPGSEASSSSSPRGLSDVGGGGAVSSPKEGPIFVFKPRDIVKKKFWF